jgi:hypothetical protein
MRWIGPQADQVLARNGVDAESPTAHDMPHRDRAVVASSAAALTGLREAARWRAANADGQRSDADAAGTGR